MNSGYICMILVNVCTSGKEIEKEKCPLHSPSHLSSSEDSIAAEDRCFSQSSLLQLEVIDQGPLVTSVVALSLVRNLACE